MLSLKIRTFYLMRHNDINGLSGIGIVAVGCVYPNGKAHMQWVSFKSSFEMHDSIDALIDIHGHHGSTELIWGDPPCAEDEKSSTKKVKKKKND